MTHTFILSVSTGRCAVTSGVPVCCCTLRICSLFLGLFLIISAIICSIIIGIACGCSTAACVSATAALIVAAGAMYRLCSWLVIMLSCCPPPYSPYSVTFTFTTICIPLPFLSSLFTCGRIALLSLLSSNRRRSC